MARAHTLAAKRPLESVEIGAELVAQWVCEAAADKKAIEPEVIDVRGKVDYADYVIVMSGRSDRQVQAIAKGIVETLKGKHGFECRGMEGIEQGHWALLDFGDVVVHVFHHDQRGYYDLESLWMDAPRIKSLVYRVSVAR